MALQVFNDQFSLGIECELIVFKDLTVVEFHQTVNVDLPGLKK